MSETNVVTLILRRETALRIFNSPVLDKDAKAEILTAFDGQQVQGETAAVQLTEEVANEWLEHLQTGQKVSHVLGATLRAAFALGIGTFLDLDPQWTASE